MIKALSLWAAINGGLRQLIYYWLMVWSLARACEPVINRSALLLLISVRACLIMLCNWDSCGVHLSSSPCRTGDMSPGSKRSNKSLKMTHTSLMSSLFDCNTDKSLRWTLEREKFFFLLLNKFTRNCFKFSSVFEVFCLIK